MIQAADDRLFGRAGHLTEKTGSGAPSLSRAFSPPAVVASLFLYFGRIMGCSNRSYASKTIFLPPRSYPIRQDSPPILPAYYFKVSIPTFCSHSIFDTAGCVIFSSSAIFSARFFVFSRHRTGRASAIGVPLLRESSSVFPGALRPEAPLFPAKAATIQNGRVGNPR